MGMLKKFYKKLNRVNILFELKDNPLTIGSDKNLYIGEIKTPLFIHPGYTPFVSINVRGNPKVCIIWQPGCEIQIKSNQISLFLRHKEDLIKVEGIDSIRKAMNILNKKGIYSYFKREAIKRTIEYQDSESTMKLSSDISAFTKKEVSRQILQVLYRDRSAGELIFSMKSLKECAYFNYEDLQCIQNTLYQAEVFLLNAFY